MTVTVSLERPDNSPRNFAIGAMVLSAACWGFATVMTKSALVYFPPFTLVTVQLVASVAFLWLAILLTGGNVPLRPMAARAALTGVLEPGIAYALGIHGVALTTASNASIIGTTEPMIVCFLAWLILRERITGLVAGGICLTFIGVLMISVANISDGIKWSDSGGDGLVVLGTTAAALYVVLSSKYVASIDPLPLAALQQSVGLLFVAAITALALGQGVETVVSADVPATAWAFAAVSGIIQYALAFWLYLRGLRVLTPGVAALFLALIPVFGVGGGILFLGEGFSLFQWFGCSIVIVAVTLVARRAYD